jgi:hypothetical protein
MVLLMMLKMILMMLMMILMMLMMILVMVMMILVWDGDTYDVDDDTYVQKLINCGFMSFNGPDDVSALKFTEKEGVVRT